MFNFDGIKVFAPATVGNLAVGFDILGLAIHGPGDEIIFNQGKEKGISIKSISGDNGKLPKELLKNTAGFAAQKVLDAVDMTEISVEMEIYKRMPIGSGMGSSAASAAAGAFGMNEVLGCPFTKKELLPFAVEAEQIADGAYHADNVAPSLLGGIILIRDNPTLDIIKLPTPVGLHVVLIYPHIKILTKDSRAILSDQLLLDNHIKQSGNLAAFVAALYKSDIDLISRSLKDVVVEPQRAKLIPHFYDIQLIAIQNNALGFSISGAGPSMFALCHNSIIAENISKAVASFMKEKEIEVDIFTSKINIEGAYKF